MGVCAFTKLHPSFPRIKTRYEVRYRKSTSLEEEEEEEEEEEKQAFYFHY